MAEEDTVIAGAEPVTEKAGAEPAEPVVSGSAPDKVPWDKDTRWQEWRGA